MALLGGWALAEAASVRSGPVVAELVAEVAAVQAGRPFEVALRLEMDAHWHTYWRNPGDAGTPTAISWELPAGFTAGDIRWPQPRRIPTPPLTSLGYEGEVLLVVTIVPPGDLAAGSVVALRGRAEWLACKESCVPGEAQVVLDLPVVAGPPAPDPRWAPQLAAARRSVPPVAPAQWRASYRVAAGAVELDVRGVPADTAARVAAFFPYEQGLADVGLSQVVEFAEGALVVRMQQQSGAVMPARMAGILAGRNGEGWAVEIEAVETPAGAIAGGLTGLLPAFGLAFLGGLVLNLMPCVFPVLGIKILGFVGQAGMQRRRVVGHGVAFTAGVLVSFWVLAAVLAASRAGGEQIGWGYQLQSPGFVFCLAVVMLVFGASSSGVFEIGMSATGLGGRVGAQAGHAGSFGSGVLATVVATPCSAPFLAPALGVALVVPPVASFVLFTAIALGLSLPYLVLSCFPSLVRALPRPGAWMESFKQAMAFPLYATAGFLVWVLAGQVGESGLLFAIMGLTLAAMAAWVYGRWATPIRRPAVRWAGRAAAAGLVAGGFALGLPRSGAHGEVVWQPWSEAAVAQARAAGRPVFVDFTARWCVTCQTNKAVVFSSADVREAFARAGVVALRADWTNRDPVITRALQALGRSAVPVNLVYLPGRERPILLPEVLTPAAVLEALGSAPGPRLPDS
jgi:thiol:disulfide interchange protein DsbD